MEIWLSCHHETFMKCQQQIANHICWFGAKIHVTQPVNAANYCWVATTSEYKWCYEVYVVLAVKYEYVDMHVVWYSGSDWSTFTLHRLSELCCDGRLHSAHQITVDLESSGAHIPPRLAHFKLTVHRHPQNWHSSSWLYTELLMIILFMFADILPMSFTLFITS